MSSQVDEGEEIIALANNQLKSIVWSSTKPQQNSIFVEELRATIISKFPEYSADCKKQVDDFSQLRNLALATFSDSVPTISDRVLNNLRRYYCQLASMVSRFKYSPAEFTWSGSSGRDINSGDLDFEINNVIFNLAACHNAMGAQISRATELQIKDACLHFRSACWWLLELKEKRPGLKSRDMSHDMLSLLFHISRAQAHECLLCHSIRSKFKPNSLARITAQIVSDYETCTKLLAKLLQVDAIQDLLQGSGCSSKNWRSTIEFKQSYFKVVMNLLSSFEYSDDNAQEVGFRISRLKIAKNIIPFCKNNSLLSDVVGPQAAKDAVESADGMISRKLERATRYNDNIYHAQVPPSDTLPLIESKILTTPNAFNISNVPDFKDIFANLVTIEAIEVNSIYSQKKDDLIRDVKNQVIDKDEQLAQLISTLNLSKTSLKPKPIAVPDELMEICVELSGNPNVVDDVLTKLEELEDNLEAVDAKLNKGEELFSKQPSKSPEIYVELKRLRGMHEEALKTVALLHKSLSREMQLNIHTLATTNSPVDLLPKLDFKAQGDYEIVGRIEKMLDQVDELKKQRLQLQKELFYSIDQDDVIKHVVVASSEAELKEVFDKEIKKHNKFLNPLLANLKAQDQLLDQLEKANAQYGEVKINYNNQRRLFTNQLESYKRCHVQFKSVSKKIEETYAHSNQLLDNATKFCSKVQAANELNDLMN